MGYKKYYLYKRQESVDGGETWSDIFPLETAPSGNPIGTYSTLAECEGLFKFRATYTGDTAYELPCDGNPTLTSGDTRPSGYDFIWTSAEIGLCVTSIGEKAFDYCRTLTSVTIPNTVTSIGNFAFRECDGLTSITIPNSVTYLGTCSFERCSGLTSVVIPDSVTSVGNLTFDNSSGLTSMHIGSGLTTIPNGFVMDCRNLSSINSNVNGVCNIPNTVTTIDFDVFNRCAFTSLTIPDSVTSIGIQAFQQCSALTTVEIGSGIQSIGKRTFRHCPLSTVIIHATTPPTIGEEVFYKDYYSIMDGIIYVPSESVNAYKTAENWSDYASRIQAIPT